MFKSINKRIKTECLTSKSQLKKGKKGKYSREEKGKQRKKRKTVRK